MVARNQVQNCMLEMLRFFTLHVLQYAVGIGLVSRGQTHTEGRVWSSYNYQFVFDTAEDFCVLGMQSRQR